MRRYDWFFLLFCLVILIPVGALWGNRDRVFAEAISTEEKSTIRTKARFLYYLSRFVVWPEHRFSESNPAITLCIIGKDPFGEALDLVIQNRNRREAFTDKSSHRNQTFMIRRLVNIENRKDCHILFISVSERKTFSKILEKLNGSSVLTVSDRAEFIRSGGMVRLAIDQKKMRFEINLNLAQKAGLKISSKLLRLARVVSLEDSN